MARTRSNGEPLTWEGLREDIERWGGSGGDSRTRAHELMRDAQELARRDGDAAHKLEHDRCEHLDGAVPVVRCMCGETFGYHVGHEGDWCTCTQGLCAD